MNPNFRKIGLCNWTLNCLIYHIWAHPVMYFFTYCALLDKCCAANTTKGFWRNWFTAFPMRSSPKYTCAWWCTSTIWICYTFREMLLAPAPLSTMNARLTQPYLLTILRKYYIISLTFETEISNLSASWYNYFGARR